MPGGQRDQIVGGGTPTDLPATQWKLPVYDVGGLQAHISDSIYGQSSNGRQILIGGGGAFPAPDPAAIPFIAIGEGAASQGAGSLSGTAIGNASTAGLRSFAGGNQANASGDDSVAIGRGSLASSIFPRGVAIGINSRSNTDSVAIGNNAGSGPRSVSIGINASAQQDGISIGNGAVNFNAGVQTYSMAIGVGASAGRASVVGQNYIAIGANSNASGDMSIAIGSGAATTIVAGNSIAIGWGATSSRANEMVIGSNGFATITVVTINAGVDVMAAIRSGGVGGVGIRNGGDTLTIFQVDESTVAGNTRCLVYDVTAALLKRVSIGVADSGGAGFKLLRVPN